VRVVSCRAGELYVRGPLKARNEAFKELLRREKQYVANLQLIVKEYMKPLKENTKGYRALCTDKEVMTIFGNVEALTPCPDSFIFSIESRRRALIGWRVGVSAGAAHGPQRDAAPAGDHPGPLPPVRRPRRGLPHHGTPRN
jgi:hypothetical protein